VDVFPGGTELEPQIIDRELGRPHTLAIIPTSSVLEFIVQKQWIILLQVKDMEFFSSECRSLH